MYNEEEQIRNELLYSGSKPLPYHFADYFRPLTGVPSLPPKTVRKTLMTNAEKKPIICGINSIFFQKGGFFQYE